MVLAGDRGAPRGEQTERPQEVHAAPTPRAREFVMFARFTPQAREAMALAQEESARLRHPLARDRASTPGAAPAARHGCEQRAGRAWSHRSVSRAGAHQDPRRASWRAD